jgi:hypothetical protein
MKIACLGWGSLVWDPRALPIAGGWFQDGPLLPVEFIRCSSSRRVTLVLDPKSRPVRVLWALMLSPDLDTAIEALRDREGVLAKNLQRDIGFWSSDRASTYAFTTCISAWALQRDLDAVIWTALGQKHPDKARSTLRPQATEIIGHLRSLTGEQRRTAETYIRRAPLQIDTDYRRHIQEELGWTPSANTNEA